MNQIFISISLPKNTRLKRFTGINFLEHKPCPSEGTLSRALARPNHNHCQAPSTPKGMHILSGHA
jgi:hypothetical protein